MDPAEGPVEGPAPASVVVRAGRGQIVVTGLAFAWFAARGVQLAGDRPGPGWLLVATGVVVLAAGELAGLLHHTTVFDAAGVDLRRWRRRHLSWSEVERVAPGRVGDRNLRICPAAGRSTSVLVAPHQVAQVRALVARVGVPFAPRVSDRALRRMRKGMPAAG